MERKYYRKYQELLWQKERERELKECTSYFKVWNFWVATKLWIKKKHKARFPQVLQITIQIGINHFNRQWKTIKQISDISVAHSDTVISIWVLLHRLKKLLRNKVRLEYLTSRFICCAILLNAIRRIYYESAKNGL